MSIDLFASHVYAIIITPTRMFHLATVQKHLLAMQIKVSNGSESKIPLLGGIARWTLPYTEVFHCTSVVTLVSSILTAFPSIPEKSFQPHQLMQVSVSITQYALSLWDPGRASGMYQRRTTPSRAAQASGHPPTRVCAAYGHMSAFCTHQVTDRRPCCPKKRDPIYQSVGCASSLRIQSMEYCLQETKVHQSGVLGRGLRFWPRVMDTLLCLGMRSERNSTDPEISIDMTGYEHQCLTKDLMKLNLNLILHDN